METLEVHSKSYLIKWVEAPTGGTITWQVRPMKKSVNFGVFRHSAAADASINIEDLASRRPSVSTSNMALEDRLVANGMEKILWHGKCISNELLRGHYDVRQGGMFALVFDNTFSKNTAKTVLFSQHVGDADDGRSSESVTPLSSQIVLDKSNSTRSSIRGSVSHGGSNVALPLVHSSTSNLNSSSASVSDATPRGHVISTQSVQQGSRSNNLPTCVNDSRYISGIILKKRRKRLQGYARRYFSLDYKYGVLNYYLGQKSSLLRGSMPIKLCVVSAIEHSRDIIIDSGAEIWTLRATNDADWKAWVAALNAARHTNVAPAVAPEEKGVVTIQTVADNEHTSPLKPGFVISSGLASQAKTRFQDRNKELRDLITQLENTSSLLSSRLASGFGTVNQDFNISQLSLDASSKDHSAVGSPSTPSTQPLPIPNDPSMLTLAERPRRRSSLWRKKSSPRTEPNPPTLSQAPSIGSLSQRYLSGDGSSGYLPKYIVKDAVHNLDDLVAKFHAFIEDIEADGARAKTMAEVENGVSADQTSLFSENDEFYDAMDEFEDGIVYLENDESDEYEEAKTAISVDDSDSYSDSDGDGLKSSQPMRISFLGDSSITIDDTKHDLYPLPLSPVKRRADIIPTTTSPPSLIGFLRKNVGKDLSSVAMPVTSNEPLTILQRYAEFLEYASLLNEAAELTDPAEVLLLISAFSVSILANQRSKVRSQRKPFNPLLGETFELVREDLGFRLVGEKVSHRPPIMAFQVEASSWTMHFTGMPKQKFWGKSVEINDLGQVRIVMKNTGDAYEFSQPASFLRNLIAGEKYVEPQGSISVGCSNGTSSEISYLKPKSSGIFGGGRSEDVSIKLFDKSGNVLPFRANGSWTSKLDMDKDGQTVRTIWQVGDLLPDFKQKYGFTRFAGTLNEVTQIEQGKMCPTDSRLRPDQQNYEKGNVDDAEKQKLELEENQRTRRKVMEEEGLAHRPTFFEERTTEGDISFYVLKSGKENYWERRKDAEWKGVLELW